MRRRPCVPASRSTRAAARTPSSRRGWKPAADQSGGRRLLALHPAGDPRRRPAERLPHRGHPARGRAGEAGRRGALRRGAGGDRRLPGRLPGRQRPRSAPARAPPRSTSPSRARPRPRSTSPVPTKGRPIQPGRQGPGPGRSLRPRHGRGPHRAPRRPDHRPGHASSPTRCPRSSRASRSPTATSGSTSTGRDFTLNPTTCDPMSGRRRPITSAQGTARQPSQPLPGRRLRTRSASSRSWRCRLKGATKRGAHPALRRR